MNICSNTSNSIMHKGIETNAYVGKESYYGEEILLQNMNVLVFTHKLDLF